MTTKTPEPPTVRVTWVGRADVKRLSAGDQTLMGVEPGPALDFHKGQHLKVGVDLAKAIKEGKAGEGFRVGKLPDES